MNLSIKNRIYYSFYILASIFIINGVIIVATISYNNKLSNHIKEVVDPSLQSLNDFKLMLILSREFSINWVFLRSNNEYKRSLREIHSDGYPALNASVLSMKWDNPQISDSLNSMFKSFESLISEEKVIMNSLSKFEDYDDPVIKFSAEDILENEVIPHTNSLLNTLMTVIAAEQKVKIEEERRQENSAIFMRVLIFILAILIVGLAIFLSLYMGRIIIRPINAIIGIVNDLGRGIIKKSHPLKSDDEMGIMIRSVNNLSEKLHSSALFAKEIGNRNFDTEFVPLSEEDNLGKALITMRNNLKSSDENLNEAQHIARLGSWERNLIIDTFVWSDELFRIFDLEISEFTPTYEGYLSLIHEDDIEYVKGFYTQYLIDFQPFIYECRIITPKGNKKIISVQGKVITDGFNKVIKTYGIIQDITQQKSSQLALENAHKQMQTLFSNIDEVFFSVDIVKNELLQMSSACKKVYGLEEKRFYENPNLWFELILDEDKQNINDNYPLMLAGKPFINEYRIHHADNSIHWLETRIKPSLDSKGKLIRIDGITANITERKMAAESLQKSEANLQTVFANANTGYILFDNNLKIIFFNGHAQKYAVEELRSKLSNGKYAIDCFPEERKQFIENTLQSVLLGNNSEYEVSCLQPDGSERWYNASYFPVADKAKQIFGAMLSLTEFTERKKSEQSLENQNNELKKTNSELDKFVYSVSHDLRAPLSSMLGVVQISEEETEDVLQLEHLDMLKGSIQKLDGFISDILDYSRNSRIEIIKEEINFKEMIKDITDHLKYMGGKNRNVAINIDINNPVPICSDKTRLSIIINNLVSNAIRYQNPNVPDPFVNIKVDTSDTETNIVIRDNGIGIKKEMHMKIFDMFYRVSEESVGSGLGLYIVQESVNKLKGHIEVESELGKGTTFRIHLPNSINCN